jgi:small-conductance mechanosensitive channel
MEVIVQANPQRKATQLGSQNAFIITIVVMMVFIMWLALTWAPLSLYSEYNEITDYLELSVISVWGMFWTIEFLASKLTVRIPTWGS